MYKTREDQYRIEVSSLLRDISMYRCLTKGQVYGLYPGKASVIKNLLSFLIKQGRIVRVGKYYCDSPESADRIDHGLMDAVWVLVDFMDRVEYHAIANYPAKIVFCADGEVYEIIHAGVGKEALISYIVSEQEKEENATKYLVLVDRPEQIEDLQTENAVGYCTVTPEGKVQYYRKE